MRRTLAFALCLYALPANAQSLRGQWDIETPNHEAFVVLLIDGERRATWDWKSQRGPLLPLFGYVARTSGPEIVIPLTDRDQVIRLSCTVHSTDEWRCNAHFLKEQTAIDGLIARRVGPGPVTLAPR